MPTNVEVNETVTISTPKQLALYSDGTSWASRCGGDATIILGSSAPSFISVADSGVIIAPTLESEMGDYSFTVTQ